MQLAIAVRHTIFDQHITFALSDHLSTNPLNLQSAKAIELDPKYVKAYYRYAVV